MLSSGWVLRISALSALLALSGCSGGGGAGDEGGGNSTSAAAFKLLQVADGTFTPNLWKTDGTAVGTMRVRSNT